MTDNRKLASDIRNLDKGITDCENFLSKVLNRKVDCSRPAAATKKKNASAKSASRPESRGRSLSRQRTPSVGTTTAKESTRSFYPARKPFSTVGSTKRISPEPTVRPKTNDGQRKRSNSVSRITSQGCKCEPPRQTDSTKLPHHLHIPSVACVKPPPTKTEPTTQVLRPRSPEGRKKHLSWGEILRGNRQSVSQLDRGQWDIGALRYSTEVNPVQYPSYSAKLPHKCEPIKEGNSRANEFTSAVPGKSYFKAPASRHHPTEESFSSTSGFSSNNDSPNNVSNKSIQCGSPIQKTRVKSGPPDHYVHHRASSTSSGASSQKTEERDATIVDGSDVFTMFNPVRTLNFLMKELQGILHKNPKEDASVCRIIADMEKVLHRLPEGGERTETSSRYTIRSKSHDSHSVTSASTQCDDVPDKPMDSEFERIVPRVLEAVPAIARRINATTESMRKKILDARTHVPVPTFAPIPAESNTNNVDTTLRWQRHVEVYGSQLEIMCQTMEQTCEALRNERNKLKVEVESRDKEIRIVKSQEQDFVTTVNTLRTNLEDSTQRATQLSVENKLLKEQVKINEEKRKWLISDNAKLKEENKELQEKVSKLIVQNQALESEVQSQRGIAAANTRLTSRLQETMKERDDAQHDLQLLQIERENLLILLHNKDKELALFVKDILNIKEMVTTQLENLKIDLCSPLSSLSPISSSSSDTEDVTITGASQRQPICSSPSSTISGMPPVGEDWQALSTILPESSPEMLLSTKLKHSEHVQSPSQSQNNFKSIDKDASLSVDPGSRPPVDRIEEAVVGDNRWTRTAAISLQELKENVNELFQIANTKERKLVSSSSTDTVRTMSSQPCATATSNTGTRSCSVTTQSLRLNRDFHFQMPVLPDPPKFLETPEFSDFSSCHGSLVESSSLESIDAVLKELQKGNVKENKE